MLRTPYDIEVYQKEKKQLFLNYLGNYIVLRSGFKYVFVFYADILCLLQALQFFGMLQVKC